MKFFKKTDLIIIFGIFIVGLALWAIFTFSNSSKPAKAEIYYKSELVATIDLNSGVDKEFSIPQNKNVIFHLTKDGHICFEKSDCPDKICVRTGMLKNVGETAACLPNEIILKIVPLTTRGDDELDMIVG
ncbi:NusG domain II-containing protein [Ruminiclostridium herbifermentans]|uniref:NusG domain II-containing protein n=1 Tax=Ruminiclostridium herbifermentans TaxID=2488810 RepID=A0A4U7JH47_9FIRM|nr:NusG domain II-containing protein [Ruminiclostridium herbifermentans]QNU65997.1 NusG domain II-containing protein [Ruminiclostridium herbifermentans]